MPVGLPRYTLSILGGKTPREYRWGEFMKEGMKSGVRHCRQIHLLLSPPHPWFLPWNGLVPSPSMIHPPPQAYLL